LVRDRLRGDIDSELRHQAETVSRRLTMGPQLIAGVEQKISKGGSAATHHGATGQQAEPPPPPPPGAVTAKEGKVRPAHPPTAGGQILEEAVPTPGPGAPPALAQVITPSGAVVTDPASQYRIPVSSTERELAASGGTAGFQDVNQSGTDLRVFTQPLATGGA